MWYKLLLMQELPMRFPPLFKLSSKGKTIVWEVAIFPSDNFPTWILQVTSGYLDGKKQSFPKEITKGKNIGKSNETSPMQQAELQAKALWVKARKEGYVENIDDYTNLYLAMLAKEYTEHSDKIVWPAIGQPKLEGIRCMVRKVLPTEVHFISREGNRFLNLEYIAPYYREILNEGEEADGELYCHGMDFEDISSLVKNPEHREDRERLIKHHCYDLPSKEPIPTIDRLEELEKRCALLPEICPVEFVQHVILDNEEEFYEAFTGYVEAGYEGIIVRNMEGVYEYGRRSYNLQKYKEFLDEEFLILDVIEGEGKFKGMAVFVCQSKHNPQDTFRVVMKGRASLKQRHLQERVYLIGKQITVQYQRLTKIGVPYLPVGIAIRDYE